MRFNIENSDKQSDNTSVSMGNIQTPVEILQKPVDVSSLNQFLTDFSSKKEIFEQMKKNLINDFRQSLNTLATEIFKTVPQLKAISWIQYTPYFNDGDECRFSIREIIYYNYSPEQVLRYAEDFDEEDHIDGQWAYNEYDLNKANLSSEVIDFLKNFESTIYSNLEFVKEIFGDHTKIVWTIDGVNTTDYSNHD